MDWWLTITTGGKIYCWHLGDVDDEARTDLITRARAIVDLPVTDRADLHGGPPHERLLSRCLIRDRAELDGVDAGALTAYRGRVDEETTRAQQAAARDMLSRLPAQELAEVLAEFT